MAILQISRIQSRRGLQENLPQLASAELGWALDSRRLFIGNGLTSEGAPTEGITEILTEHSNLTSLSSSYYFTGNVAGAEIRTTPLGSISPYNSRTVQSALDDSINLRDFYVDAALTLGDGIMHGPSSPTHDTVENPVDTINRAITELYRESLNPFAGNDVREQRILFIPAGTYLLWGDFIRLFPNVKLVGEGKNSTILIQMDPLQHCAISSCDSNWVTGFSYASSPVVGSITPLTTIGAPVINAAATILPGKFEVSGMTFINASNHDVVYFDSVTDVLFDRVSMQGNASVITSNACVKIGATTTGSQLLSSNIVFNECDFANGHYAFYADNNVTNVTINGGALTNLNNGIALAANVANATISSVRVTCSMFDQIANAAIKANNISHVVSAYNTFKTVSETPQVAIVDLNGDSCYSIGDMFNRASNSAVQSVSIHGKASFAALDSGRLLLGSQLTSAGSDVVLAANVSIPTSGNVGVIGYGLNASIVEYAITRNSDQRVGALKVSNDGNSIVYSDDYVQSNDVGVTLTPVIIGGIVELQYTATPGNAATVKTSSRTLI